MNLKKYNKAIYIGFLILIYLCGYLISIKYPHNIENSNAIEPFAFEPICPKDDLVVSLTSTNESICFDNKKRFYVNKNGENYPVYSLVNNEEYLTAGNRFIITRESERILIITFDNILAKSDEQIIELSQNEEFISSWYDTEYLYITTMLEAKSMNDDKTRIFKIKIDREEKGKSQKIDSYATKNMYQIDSARDNQDKSDTIIRLSNPFSFLEYYSAELNWKSKGLRKIEIAQEKDKNGFQLSASSSISINEDKKLHYNYNNMSRILMEYTNLQQIDRNKGIQCLKIGETVYNCNDFGESTEITLRVCIPKNEKTIKKNLLSKQQRDYKSTKASKTNK